MHTLRNKREDRDLESGRTGSWPGSARIALPVIIVAIAFFVLYLGFIFLRDGNAPKWLITIVAIVWGVGGVAALYWIFNWIVEMLPDEWMARLQPFVFIGPAMAILFGTWPIPRYAPSGSASLAETDRQVVNLSAWPTMWPSLPTGVMLEAFRNNILFWMVIATL